MNVLQKGARSVRIVALPLARVKASQGSGASPYSDLNANTTLVFYYFDLNYPPHGNHKDPSWHKKVLKSAVNKVAELWTSFGKAPSGSWKLRTYEFGQSMADRIDFEELALASVDPTLGPTATPLSETKQVNESQPRYSLQKIPLIYPPSLYPSRLDNASDPALAHLRTLLATRRLRHRRGFYLWMLISPLTLPVMLIPLIPNLPLFFCVWRSWSHYRAYRSSQYLSSLVDRRLIEPDPNSELDKIYASFTPPSRISQNLLPPTSPSLHSENKSTNGGAATSRKSRATFGTEDSLPEDILLTEKAVLYILDILRLPASVAVDIHRAVDQARGRLREFP